MVTNTRLLTVAEAALRLGLREGTLRHWLRQRRIEKVRIGARSVRVSEATVEAIIRSGVVDALSVGLVDSSNDEVERLAPAVSAKPR